MSAMRSTLGRKAALEGEVRAGGILRKIYMSKAHIYCCHHRVARSFRGGSRWQRMLHLFDALCHIVTTRVPSSHEGATGRVSDSKINSCNSRVSIVFRARVWHRRSMIQARDDKMSSTHSVK